MRTKNSIRNISYALIGQLLATVISFVARMVFVRTLSIDYLGVNGLFTNVLSVLSLADLGIGTSISYNLYKHLSTKDEKRIRAYMHFYVDAYRLIGSVVLVLGVAVLPFLGYLTKAKPNVSNINLIYLLFLASTVVTYFFAAKRNLIIADQKNNISLAYKYGFFIALNIIQIVILLLTKNYIIFLATQVASNFLENLCITYKADKMYSFLRNGNEKLESHAKQEIYKNLYALMFHRFGSVIVFSSTSMIISKYIGVSWVGLFSNYGLIIAAINTVMGQIYTSVTASVGNLNASDDKEKTYFVYKSLHMITFWSIAVIAILMLVLLNDFMRKWLGPQYLLSTGFVLLLVINAYVSHMRRVNLMFRDSLGLFWYDRYKPVAEVIVNIIAVIILVQRYQLVGALMGTLISTMTVCFWIEPLILYKYGFKRNCLEYFVIYIKYSFVLAVTAVITLLVTACVHGNGMVVFLGKGIICLVITNSILWLIYHNTLEYRYIISAITIACSRKTRGIGTLTTSTETLGTLVD